MRSIVSVSPRSAGSAVLTARNRCERTRPPRAETSPSGASSNGMWQSWHSFLTGSPVSGSRGR
jgi:hypothetical protein